MSPPAARAIPPTSAPATPTFPTCERSTFEISTFGRLPLPAALSTPVATPCSNPVATPCMSLLSRWCVTVVWWKPAFAFICPFKFALTLKPPAPCTAPDEDDDQEDEADEDDDQEDEVVLCPSLPPQFHCNSKFPCRSHLTSTISVLNSVLQPFGTTCASPVPFFVLRSCFRSILFSRSLRCFSICSLLGGLHSPPYPEEECVHQDVE